MENMRNEEVLKELEKNENSTQRQKQIINISWLYNEDMWHGTFDTHKSY